MGDRILRQIVGWLDALERNALAFLALLTIVALGLVDYWSGPQIAFSVFYLLPLSVLALTAGLRLAVLASCLAAGTWATADIASGQHYEAAWIHIWNTSTRLLVFLVVVALFHNVRRSLAVQEDLASRDSLTGVANGRTFNLVAQDWFVGVQRLNYPFTVVYIDLDNFKSINDTLGHSGGDDVLQATAQALNASTRNTDIVARLGGDEFGMLLPATDSQAATSVMESLLPRVQEALKDFPPPVSFSAGAATFLVPPRDTDEIVEVADELMYQAKRAQKGTFRHIVVGIGDKRAVVDNAPRRTFPNTTPVRPRTLKPRLEGSHVRE